jgi:hypothetical protein
MQQNSFIVNLLSAQHVSGTIMPIIRSSRLYRWLCNIQHILEILWQHTSRNDEIRLILPHFAVVSSAVYSNNKASITQLSDTSVYQHVKECMP